MEILQFLLILLLFCFIIILLKKFKFINIQYENQRKEFVEYLYSIGDLITLKKIGEINRFNQEERWYPNFTKIENTLREKEDKDNNFFEFNKIFACYKKEYNKYFSLMILSLGIIDTLLIGIIENSIFCFLLVATITFSFFIYIIAYLRK